MAKTDHSTSIWLRRKDESAEAYLAFKTFLELGTERTVVQAYEQAKGKQRAKQASGRWNAWVAKYDWHNRAAAYDSHLAVIEQVAKEEALEKEAAKWAKRQESIREEGWQLYESLKAKAEAMLRFPVHKTEIKEKQTIIMPADWNFNTAARIADTAVKLGRLAADLSTDNLDIDFDQYNLEQLKQIKRSIRSGKTLAQAIRGLGEDRA